MPTGHTHTCGEVPVVLDAVVRGLEAEDHLARGEEVARVVYVWKPSRSAESSPHSSCSRNGGCAELGRRERDVQEEADLRARQQVAQHLRQQQQVVVVHPHDVAVVVHVLHRVGERLVHGHARLPQPLLLRRDVKLYSIGE